MNALTLSCLECRAPFAVLPEELVFLKSLSLKLGTTEIPIPAPKLCRDCRLFRRNVHLNDEHFFTTSCDLCGKKTVGMIPEGVPYPVYCRQCWWGDDWNPYDYGRPYDSTKSFIEQLINLWREVPHPAVVNDDGVGSENCAYTHDCTFSKNAYFTTTVWKVQDILYSSMLPEGRDLVDCHVLSENCELCYECTFSRGLYNCSNLSESVRCQDCHFGFDLRNCSHCIGCAGLRHKQYCIFNEQLSQQDYEVALGRMQLSSRIGRRATAQKYQALVERTPHCAALQVNCVDCTGDSIFNSKACSGTLIFNCEDSHNLFINDGLKNCRDLTQSGLSEWCYDGFVLDLAYQSAWCTWCREVQETYYSTRCYSGKYLFGCSGIRKGEYTILNRRYSRDDYFALLNQIVLSMQLDDSWGIFPPPASSEVPLSLSRAANIRGLGREDALKLGSLWHEGRVSISDDALPIASDSCSNGTDSQILGQYRCCSCNRAYKIIQQELNFYRKQGLPPPDNCPLCRRRIRLGQRPQKIGKVNCSNCGELVSTHYSQSELFPILCHKCALSD